MWIVRLALRRPYTFIVLAMLIVLFGVFSILRTPTDIFPNINIPVISAIWSYTGLPPEDLANRIVANAERYAQTTVNDVEHSESQSLSGISIVKYFFQPNVNEELAYAQITGVSQTLLRQAPPGTTPPFILAYNASTVPILQLALSSATLSEAQIFDMANTIVRPGLATVARQLLVSLKSPLALMVVIARLLVPVFESVTVCVVLAIPTVWLPKFSIDGESPTPGAVPVPVSARTNWPVPVPTV